jgi:phage tail protein X
MRRAPRTHPRINRVKYVWAIIGGLIAAAGVLLVGGDPAGPDPVERSSDATLRTPSTTRSDSASSPDREVAIPPSSDEIKALTWILTEGDTLPEIARRRYGDDRLWRRIVDANPGLAAGELELGDQILLPDLQDIPEPVIDAAALVADLDAGRENRGEAGSSIQRDEPVRIEMPSDAPTLDLGLDREIPDATVVPGTLVRDGDTIVADGLYRIPGDGTRDSPHVVSWELLSSAGSGYRPSLGERSMPQRIAALDGKWIRIEGYVAFPLGGADTSELLVMLNQWDGCCIGIPPTPYDAIEVALKKAVPPAERHSINFGTLTGRLVVSPYLVENWLVGLYLMDDATVRFES